MPRGRRKLEGRPAYGVSRTVRFLPDDEKRIMAWAKENQMHFAEAVRRLSLGHLNHVDQLAARRARSRAGGE